MSKLTVIGSVPNTDLSWEKLEYEAWIEDRKIAIVTDYLLTWRDHRGHRHVGANLDMGQLVALRASIDALVAAEAQEAEKAEK